ncbi:MAG: hypothetical protein OXD48_04240, partial [Litoreibacter sp.]|nr:hypothetical protein [Litoreibacter sp.]
LAQCLDALDAVPFWGGDPKWDLGSVEDHLNWRSYPATITHLDQLFVTKHGMLDIPFALIPDYALLIGGSTKRRVGRFEIDICDPRSVLVALETRNRKKDTERARVYAELRVRFGLPPVP